jgi:anti-sigma factor RsiW
VSHLGERLSAFVDGELSHQQRERVLAHLANCAPCRREATALRLLKQRMHALGEATADTALTDRLIAVAGVAGPAPWERRLRAGGRRAVPGPRSRWPVRSLAVAGLTLAGFGVPVAAFLAGGGPPGAGPTVTPAIDSFMVQHEISNGNAPAVPAPPSAPAAPAATATAAPVMMPGAVSVLSAAGAAAVSARVASALVRVAAASTRVASVSLGTSGPARPARHARPHAVMTAAAGAR